jgi:hypothetical protein
VGWSRNLLKRKRKKGKKGKLNNMSKLVQACPTLSKHVSVVFKKIGTNCTWDPTEGEWGTTGNKWEQKGTILRIKNVNLRNNTFLTIRGPM